MSGILEQACAVALAYEPEETFSVLDQTVKAQDYLQIRRLNHLLSFELSLMVASSDLTVEQAHEIAIKVVAHRLLIGLPTHIVKAIIQKTHEAFEGADEGADDLHYVLGRYELVKDLPTMSRIADDEQFVVFNILSKLLQEDDSPQPLILCFTELLTRLLILKEISFDSLVEIADLPAASYENNVLDFTK
jgi:hypothetical protein